MEPSRDSGLSGAWMGRYAYSGAAGGGAVAFNAWLTDAAGALSGETMEPNTFAPIPADTLMAVLSGEVRGQDVTFTKRYTDFHQPPICYSGAADASGRRIAGEWRIGGWPAVRGTFVMVREARRARAKEREAEAV